MTKRHSQTHLVFKFLAFSSSLQPTSVRLVADNSENSTSIKDMSQGEAPYFEV